MTSEWERSEAAKQAASSLAQAGGAKSMRGSQDVAKLFNNKIIDLLKSKGKRTAAWDEAQHTGNFPSDGIVFAWRSAGEAMDAVTAGRQAVVADMGVLYFDHAQASQGEPDNQGGCSSWRDVYQYDFLPADITKEQEELVLGAQGQLWSEYMPNWTHVEYMAHPRSMALAEATWTPKAKLQTVSEFEVRLRQRLGDLDRLGAHYKGLEGTCGSQ